jgi:hypothetical protein
MNLRKETFLTGSLLGLILGTSIAMAQDPETASQDPHAQHHTGSTPAAPVAEKPAEPSQANPSAPADASAEKAGESSSKGLVVHRAPDFCMKKDPPPHCAE